MLNLFNTVVFASNRVELQSKHTEQCQQSLNNECDLNEHVRGPPCCRSSCAGYYRLAGSTLPVRHDPISADVVVYHLKSPIDTQKSGNLAIVEAMQHCSTPTAPYNHEVPWNGWQECYHLDNTNCLRKFGEAMETSVLSGCSSTLPI